MTTVAEIAKLAFDGVQSAITDAVHSASLEVDAQGAYDATAGTHALTTTTYTGGRAVLDMTRPPADIFPDYVVGPRDQMILLEGFTSVPEEGWRVIFAGTTYDLQAVQDIAKAGTLFYVIGRER